MWIEFREGRRLLRLDRSGEKYGGGVGGGWCSGVGGGGIVPDGGVAVLRGDWLLTGAVAGEGEVTAQGASTGPLQARALL